MSISEEERDLGVIMTNNLKPSAQYAKATQTASAILGLITRAFQYRDKNVYM